MAKQLYTREGYQKLINELDEVTQKIVENNKDLAIAKGFGDLSENAEYHAAKEAQRQLDTRLHELNELIQNAEVINEDEVDASVVSLGSIVKFKKENGDICEYSIVGSNEADPDSFKISDQSPIGKKLIGSRAGSKVVVEVPSGRVSFDILEVSRVKA
jgi:transcription elongation factor GreA